MLSGKVNGGAWFRGLGVKFLVVVVPIFLLLSLPGLAFLVEHELHEEHDGLATRVGSAAARAALVLQRHGGLENQQLASDILSSLSVDRAFLCAELSIEGRAKPHASVPGRLGCSGYAEATELILPVGDDGRARLLVKFTDAELTAARAQRKTLTMLVVGLSFLFAVIAAAAGFRLIVGRPLGQLLAAIRDAADGTQRRSLKSDRADEFGVVMRAFDELISRDARRRDDLATVNAALRASQAELEGLNQDLDQRIQERTAELQEREEALQKSQQRFRHFAVASSDWFWEMDAQLRFCYFSDRFTEITGVPQDVLLGKTREETGIPNVDLDAWEEHLAKLHARRPFRNFVHPRTKSDGGIVWLAISGVPVYDDDEQFMGYCGTGTDITERREIEQALAESRATLVDRVMQLESAKQELEERSSVLAALAADLEIARDEAKAADRAKSQFLANMSHEFRTPLNAIIGFSEIIKEELFGPHSNDRYREYAEDINGSGQHLLALINDLLDLSKIEAGSAELHEEVLDIRLAADVASKLVAGMAQDGRVEIIMDLQADLPDFRLDRRKIIQVLVNLLSNAIKFTPHGGSVTLAARWQQKDGMTMQVIDTGIGMAPEDIPKALKQFAQVGTAIDRMQKGTGLGLPLTKGLVELHGGSFEMTSELDVGTTVTIRLPPERAAIQADRVA